MKKKILIGISVILYAVSCFLIGCYFYVEFSESLILSPGTRVAILLLSCLFMYPGGVLLSLTMSGRKKDMPLKINLAVWLLLYLILLGTLTLFDEYFSRGGFHLVEWNRQRLESYVAHSMNLIPFATIGPYVMEFLKGNLAAYIFVYNIFGNLAALMPLGFFLPILFRKQEVIRVFFLTTLGIVIAIELLQFATLSGSCDIDDVILNVSGACMMYGILRIRGIKRLVRRIFLREENHK